MNSATMTSAHVVSSQSTSRSDKAGKISSKDNYRPIALASVISKLVEVIMLDRIEIYVYDYKS